MKRLWTSQIAFSARLTMFVALGAALTATIIYTYKFAPNGNAVYALVIGFAYGFCAALFALHLLPALITEHKTNRELNARGYTLAKDQNVRVIFNPDGSLDEIFYRDMSYKLGKSHMPHHKIHSSPIHKNPQVHDVLVTGFVDLSFSVVTERLSSGQIVSTVYDCNA